MHSWNSSSFCAGACTYIFVSKPLLSINIGCQSENTRTALSSEGLSGFLLVSRTYYFQVNNWYIFHFYISFLSAADHCAVSNLCKNGGVCINGEYSFECKCLPGFYGKDCGGIVSKLACVAVHASQTSFNPVCEAASISFLWALNGLNELLKMRFKFPFNLIGESTMAF